MKVIKLIIYFFIFIVLINIIGSSLIKQRERPYHEIDLAYFNKDFLAGIKILELDINKRKANNNYSFLAYDYKLLAEFNRCLNKIDKSKYFLNQALKISEKHKLNHELLLEITTFLSFIYLKSNDLNNLESLQLKYKSFKFKNKLHIFVPITGRPMATLFLLKDNNQYEIKEKGELTDKQISTLEVPTPFIQP